MWREVDFRCVIICVIGTEQSDAECTDRTRDVGELNLMFS
jgi:hypothetical protein